MASYEELLEATGKEYLTPTEFRILNERERSGGLEDMFMGSGKAYAGMARDLYKSNIEGDERYDRDWNWSDAMTPAYDAMSLFGFRPAAAALKSKLAAGAAKGAGKGLQKGYNVATGAKRGASTAPKVTGPKGSMPKSSGKKTLDAPDGKPGMMQKGIDLVKRNPKTAAVGGVAAGIGAGAGLKQAFGGEEEQPEGLEPLPVEAVEENDVNLNLDQPEGGMPMTPEGQAQAAMQAKANSRSPNKKSGTRTIPDLAQGRVQAEADRLADDIIKQNKIDERKKATLDLENDTMSAKDAQYRNLYDSSGGRKAGAWDALDAEEKKQMLRNYNLNRSAGAPSMNSPSLSRSDGTATTAEFGSMNPAQQRAFIQNYKYKPQGQTPETVQEGLMGNAMISSNPLDNLGTHTLTPFMTEEEQDDIVTQSLGSPKTENLSPFIPGSFPANQPVTAAEKQGVLPPALRQQSEPEAPTSIQRDPSQGLLNLSNPSQVLPPQDFANEIIKSLPNPIPQKSNEFDVSKLPVLEEVQTTENEIPDFSNVPSTAPAPQAGLTRPQGMPPREEGFEEFLKPDPPQAKPKGQSPVYGKKPDGTYGITGYRNLADMKTGAYTPTMANNERRASQDQRARSGEMENPFAHLGGTYNRALGQQNEDAYAKRRQAQAELAKKAARQREQEIFNPYSV